MEAGEYALTLGMCFVARRLEVVAVAGLMWISWCVLGAARFRFFRRVFSSAHGLLQVWGRLALFTYLLVYLDNSYFNRPLRLQFTSEAVLIEIVRTTGFGDCLLTGIVQAIDFGERLLIGIVQAIDFGERLIIGIVQTMNVGGHLLIGIVWAIDVE